MPSCFPRLPPDQLCWRTSQRRHFHNN